MSDVWCVAVLPNGDVVSGSRDNTLKIWSRSTQGDGNGGGNGGEQCKATDSAKQIKMPNKSLRPTANRS